MFCPKCGSNVPDSTKFCPTCGETLAGEPAQQAPVAEPQPQYQQPQQPMRQNPAQQPYSSASYAPRRPIMADEPVAAPIPQQRQNPNPVIGENDIRRDYQEKPKSKLDVPAFLRNR